MDETRLFKLVRQVADLAFEYGSPDIGSDLWLEDRRNEEVNPRYHQAESGLFLELYYGIPGSIWTPWGNWNCWGSGSGNWNDAIQELLKRLGAVEHIPLKRSLMGEIGPVYALTSVHGVPLPPAVERRRDEHLTYEKVMEAWRSLAAAA